MEGIVLAVLALLSVPVLLIVILVKVCGLENTWTVLRTGSWHISTNPNSLSTR